MSLGHFLCRLFDILKYNCLKLPLQCCTPSIRPVSDPWSGYFSFIAQVKIVYHCEVSKLLTPHWWLQSGPLLHWLFWPFHTNTDWAGNVLSLWFPAALCDSSLDWRIITHVNSFCNTDNVSRQCHKSRSYAVVMALRTDGCMIAITTHIVGGFWVVFFFLVSVSLCWHARVTTPGTLLEADKDLSVGLVCLYSRLAVWRRLSKIQFSHSVAKRQKKTQTTKKRRLFKEANVWISA